MRTRLLATVAALAMLSLVSTPGALRAQAPAALSGQVSSQEEGNMEGVLVSAKKTGSHHHHHGRQRRAGPFQLPGVEARARAIHDLDPRDRLRPRTGRRRSSSPPTSPRAPTSSWSRPRTSPARCRTASGSPACPAREQQKLSLLNCVSCHTLERIVKSSYDSDGFQTQILPRMGSYANQSMPIHPQRRMATRLLEERGDVLAAARKKQADFLSLDQSERGRRPGSIRSRRCRARRAAAPRSSSPNTICRARPSSRMT